MIHPVAKQTFQQIRAPQKRTVRRCPASKYHMIAAARAGVFSVKLEFFRSQASQSSFFVDDFRSFDQLLPGG